ncbi:helix-hairpin-helix domain-containing protein [Pedobacter africanus]|uniref:Type II secretion system (T2SS), protein K n=1 Tax=Pedobacter africanus TaxID=151894 RepID=A0A1W1YMK5_9SPHI|nr:type II secretion system protein GspK [Pedobacter africanus]SMC37417.1 Type II secretion system (T2SS), protein K [Pedobacter africanus]
MRRLCVLFLLLVSLNGLAQEDEKIKDIIESLAENIPEDADLSELTEKLAHFRKHPINLNRTKPEELKNLVFLSAAQIASFFNYLNSNAKLLDVLELQAIPGFDITTINRLLPFVCLSSAEDYAQLKAKNLLTGGSHDLIVRYSRLMQQQKGFKALPGSRYLGSPEKVLLRYKYQFSNILSAALVMEKDAGETLFNKKTGMDHLSGHLAFFKLGRLKKLVLGDYSLQFGQGLTLWSGFAFGKGPDVTSVAAKDMGLKPYTSANEASFFRGTASTIDLGRNIHISPFVSYRKLDASLKALPDGSFTLSNINISGLHRTQTELKNKRTLGQLVYGGTLQYLSDNLNMGIIGYQSAYQHQFVTGTALYNKYAFTGQQLTNTGLHYNYTFRNTYFYGELAYSLGSGWAMVNGAVATLSPKLSAVLLYRHYSKDYHNFFSSAVGEGTEANNEQGWYAGINYSPIKSLTWSVYTDYFKFPWLKYRVDAASSGYEGLSQLSYIRAKIFKAVIRYKREQKLQNPDAASTVKGLLKVIKQSCRLEGNWKPDRKFSFQQRVEIVQYQKGDNPTETGFLVYQDVSYAPMSSRISGNMRLAYFNTPSYNSRIYAYEDDVLYGSGSGNYSGKGIRTYVNVRYRPFKKVGIWGRFAIYSYGGVETIGSGLDEIEGSKKTEVKLQLRCQF